MSVRISGSTFSSIVFDQLHAPSDQEGLLIGEIVTQTESSISDAHIDTQTKCIIYQIERAVMCPTLRFFYDKKGNIVSEKLKELLRDTPHKSILGWYKSRQNSTLAISLWEKRVHQNLCQFISSMIGSAEKSNSQPLFALFTSTQNSNCSNRVQNHKFYTIKHGNYVPVKAQITNLGNTTSVYKQVESYPSIQQYSSVNSRHRDVLVDPDTNTPHTSQQTENLASELCLQLQLLCGEVEQSEQEIATLLDDMDSMRRVLCATISQSQQLDTPVDPDPPSDIGDIIGQYNQPYDSQATQGYHDNTQDLVAGASTNAVTVSDVNLIDFEDSPTENNANTFTFNNELNDSFEHVEYANKNTQPSTDTQSETHNMGSLRLNLALASPQAGRGAISALTYAVNENAIIPSPSPPPSPVY